MNDRIHFVLNRLRERLWLRPLIYSVVSVGGTFAAKLLDTHRVGELTPTILPETNESLLSIMGASMLVIATFAVSSMVAAYDSATHSSTPRSFPLVVSDDRSKRALSVFMGAFIYSIITLVAVKNGFYGEGGQFVLFALTLLVLALVVFTFARWMDSIARLGRLANTVDRVEQAAMGSLRRRMDRPALGGVPVDVPGTGGRRASTDEIGYVQHVDMERLQAYAEQHDCRVVVAALPGTFLAPGVPLAFVEGEVAAAPEDISQAFRIGGERVYDDDPRFGLIALSEIASRALSPAVNDPGTAIDVIGTLVRLLSALAEPRPADEPTYDRVIVPRLSVEDLFDDAFTAIARDGAGCVEVAIRLQKAFTALAATRDPELSAAAHEHARTALARADRALTAEVDLAKLRDVALRPAS